MVFLLLCVCPKAGKALFKAHETAMVHCIYSSSFLFVSGPCNVRSEPRPYQCMGPYVTVLTGEKEVQNLVFSSLPATILILIIICKTGVSSLMGTSCD